ncbi:MAG: hypothetical protein LBT51_00600 [Fusobacteriaceae bacterium]|jgi:hypothetical protein|nr:hypothetical protein [Fusobacteriaceae bacterium]
MGFVHAWFTMNQILPSLNISKLLLDAAHDAMIIYEYCGEINVLPFIDLHVKKGVNSKYKEKFTIDKDGIPICPTSHKMKSKGIEKTKYRAKFR